MNRHLSCLTLAIMTAFLTIQPANSADLFPMKIGQKFIYRNSDSADPPNLWTTEFKVIEEVIRCSNNYFHFQIWDYGDEIDMENHYIRTTENDLYMCDSDSGTECSTFGNGTVGATWTCGNDFIEIMAPAEVTVPYGGPYTAVVNRKYNYVKNSPHRFVYFVPGLGWIKQFDYWADYPPTVLELVQCTCIGDLDGDDNVDGVDLSIQVGEWVARNLKNFADNFGTNNCASTICN